MSPRAPKKADSKVRRVAEDEGKPSKTPATRRAVPPEVLAAITAAPCTTGVFQVDKPVVTFTGQVLKCDSLVFQPNGRLLLTANFHPWLAIVARDIKFAAPDIEAEIGIQPAFTPNPTPAQDLALPPAAKGSKGGRAQVGGPGADGLPGKHGINGADAPPAPTLYIVAARVSVQPGAPAPDYIALTLYNPSRYPHEGQAGQEGQQGGKGGDGGNSVWSGVRCEAAARSGGQGGAGGAGGNGGNGGKGGDGGNVHYVGSASAIDLLEYSKIFHDGKRGGEYGRAGANGAPGLGGARGSRKGDCKGGSTGPSGKPSAAVPLDGNLGEHGKKGETFGMVMNVNALFCD